MRNLKIRQPAHIQVCGMCRRPATPRRPRATARSCAGAAWRCAAPLQMRRKVRRCLLNTYAPCHVAASYPTPCRPSVPSHCAISLPGALLTAVFKAMLATWSGMRAADGKAYGPLITCKTSACRPRLCLLSGPCRDLLSSRCIPCHLERLISMGIAHELKGCCLLAGETGQPLSEDSSGKHNRHSSMPILSKIRSSINRRLSSGKDTPKMTAAAQQAVAAH